MKPSVMQGRGRNLFKRQLIRLKGWAALRSVGLAPRLIVAFISVAALAAAANLIVEHGAAILEQQRNVALEHRARDSQAIDTLQQSMRQALRVVTTAELSAALAQFERAVQENVEFDTRASILRFQSTRIGLDRALKRYLDESGEASAQPLLRMTEAHKKSADVWLQSTRERRELLKRYTGLLADMDARIKAALDRSWKIMGRVVTQQPLLDARARIGDLRTAFANPGTAPVAAAETALSETLRNHGAALRRSQGAEWYQALEGERAALTATSTALALNDKRRVRAVDNFARESKRLFALLPENVETQFPAVTVQGEVPAAMPAPVEPEAHNRSLVAWLSAVVLVVLLYIGFMTIFSIVRPVRRLIAATHRLAQGGNARVVANGGIRELETLATAFNSMAEQLEAARMATRDAHQRLEAKVEERTRQLQELAEQDPLTGIANRRQLFIALNQALDRASISGERVGLFFLDIDNFKTLNDSMGHPYGDRVLVAIARRLEAVASRCGFAARLGGDEFTIVHQGSNDTEAVLAFGATIVSAFDAPLKVDDREVIVSVSVGASVFPDHERDAEALLRAADAALFRAKALGRSQVATFTPELLATASAKFDIEQRLRRAIHNGEFQLFYQPLVDLQTLDVALVEALIRWRMPDGSFRSPMEFLEVAEESGLIVEISDWVLRTAICTAAKWHKEDWPKARVAINVSPRQFLDYRFVSKLEGLLKAYGLPPECIEIELTESVLQTGAHTIKAMEQLRAIGVSCALDDFGTGYSSMASLQQLPLSRVKLDRSLIAGIDDSARSAAIVRATIALCHGLGLDVTAEGVERLEQFAMLLPQRPISLQGYLLSRPVSGDDLLPLLKRLPGQCLEMVQESQALLARKRRGGLALVGD